MENSNKNQQQQQQNPHSTLNDIPPPCQVGKQSKTKKTRQFILSN